MNANHVGPQVGDTLLTAFAAAVDALADSKESTDG